MKNFIKDYWWISIWMLAIHLVGQIVNPYTIEKPRRLPILLVVSGVSRHRLDHYVIVEYKNKSINIRCDGLIASTARKGDTLKINLSDKYLKDISPTIEFLFFIKWVLIIFGIFGFIVIITNKFKVN